MSESPSDEPEPGSLAEYFRDLFAWMREEVGVDLNEALKGSDWMLVVMLHAMIETALNRALVLELRDPRLEEVISKLDTSDKSRGKAAFAVELEMLDKPLIAFLQALSMLRNFCVHSIRNFKFDLVRHLAEHKTGHEIRVNLRKGIAHNIPEEGKEEVRALGDNNPRLALFAGTFNIMAQLHLHNEKCRTRDATEEGYRLKAARLDEIEPRRSTPKQ